MARIFKRATASKLPYVSFELRSKQLLELAAFDPAETWQIFSKRFIRFEFPSNAAVYALFDCCFHFSVMSNEALRHLEASMAGIERGHGFRELVLKLLHMQPSEYTRGMSERELASLLYRDHLGLKHANRRRLQAELEHAKEIEDKQIQAVTGHELHSVRLTDDPLLMALINHLKQDSW